MSSRIERILRFHTYYDPMHIFKNGPSSLWRHISSKKSDTLAIMRDLIPLNAKNNYWPRQESRGEASPYCILKKVMSHGF